MKLPKSVLFVQSRWIGCLGFALIISPVYLYSVDRFQADVFNFWFNTLSQYQWGTASTYLIFAGIYLIVVNRTLSMEGFKFKLGKFTIIIFAFIYTFGTWIFSDGFIAYIGIIGFWIFTSLSLEFLLTMISAALDHYNRLEPFEKLTITIPLLTIIINNIWRR